MKSAANALYNNRMLKVYFFRYILGFRPTLLLNHLYWFDLLQYFMLDDNNADIIFATRRIGGLH
jgi:hypothetical protein